MSRSKHADPTRLGRREVLRLGAAAALAWPGLARAGGGATAAPRTEERMETRPIPSTGEPLPVIGLGTWQVFDAGTSAAERAPLKEVLRTLFDAGGRAIDSSPMYGRAEGVVGDLLRAEPAFPRPFVATKVWTRGRVEGERAMAESERRMGGRLDLLQVHNLLDVEVHLPTLRAWREQGRVRHVGITHYARSAFPELERLLRTERLDFVQLPYSAATLEAEARLLPLAREKQVAVIVMRPFEEGALFAAVKGRAVPAWAAEVGATSWAQLFLKFILAHPAVTLVIPATAKPAHMADNAAAGRGPALAPEHRKRLLAELAR
jgi:aryl-alcohol dehydrogenase-like predicted oxidoreductase